MKLAFVQRQYLSSTEIINVSFFRSSGHFVACINATTTRLSTTLAMFHILLTALFLAPFTDIRAQLTYLLAEWTVAGNGIGA
jgi:hypothetical protein